MAKAIKEFVESFRGEIPALYEHFIRAVEAGATRCYSPALPVHWQF